MSLLFHSLWLQRFKKITKQELKETGVNAHFKDMMSSLCVLGLQYMSTASNLFFSSHPYRNTMTKEIILYERVRKEVPFSF